MPSTAQRAKPPRSQRGMTLIETMVGIVIGMIAVLVVYQVYSVSERFKRNTTTSADAQTTGLFSMYFLSRDVSNAGAGVTLNYNDLATCLGAGAQFRPIPVLITDGGADATPDSMVVFYSVANNVVTASTFQNPPMPAGNQYRVQSPLGFASGDFVVAVNATNGECESSVVNAVAVDPLTGVATVTLGAAAAFAMPEGASLVNLGPQVRATRTLYDVDANNILRSQDLFAAGAPNPLASNIVNFKAQYGLDVNDDDIIDTWTPATGIWSAANLADPVALPAAALIPQLFQIKAVRVGIVVRADEPDPALASPNAFNWTLFPCPPLPAVCTTPPLTGSIVGGATFGYRYRVYEAVIPLRNAIWNSRP